MNHDQYEEFTEYFRMVESSTERLVIQLKGRQFNRRGISTFAERVDILKKAGKITEKSAEIFNTASRIRNINSHGGRPRGHKIVYPTQAFVLEFIYACDEILDKIPLNEFFSSIKIFGGDDRVDRVLQYMNVNDYSQVVVECYSKRIRVLTSQDFMQWIIKKIDNGAIMVETDKTMGSILDDCGKSEWTCCKSSGYLREVHAAFRLVNKKGKNLQAVLLTDSGKPECPVRGIITPWDIKGIYG